MDYGLGRFDILGPILSMSGLGVGQSLLFSFLRCVPGFQSSLYYFL